MLIIEDRIIFYWMIIAVNKRIINNICSLIIINDYNIYTVIFLVINNNIIFISVNGFNNICGILLNKYTCWYQYIYDILITAFLLKCC